MIHRGVAMTEEEYRALARENAVLARRLANMTLVAYAWRDAADYAMRQLPAEERIKVMDIAGRIKGGDQ